MQSKDWPNIAGLIGRGDADIGFIGAPMTLKAVPSGTYERAPKKFRHTLRKISTYDLETGDELADMRILDYGDIDIKNQSPKDGFAPIVKSFGPLTRTHKLSALIGGHSGITRPGVHALDPSLKQVGLLTLNNYLGLHPTKDGLSNRNSVRALLEDGLPGAHIAQIGLAPFVNTAKTHAAALKAGMEIYTQADCRQHGLGAILTTALHTLSKRVDMIYVDFNMDAIDKSRSPGAPGARSGGLSSLDFFKATRLIGAHSKVQAVGLCEFDPGLDTGDMTALIAGRWFGELLAGFKARPCPLVSASDTPPEPS